MRGVKIAVGLVVLWALRRAWKADERPAAGRNRTPHKVRQPAAASRPRAKPEAKAGSSGR